MDENEEEKKLNKIRKRVKVKVKLGVKGMMEEIGRRKKWD